MKPIWGVLIGMSLMMAACAPWGGRVHHRRVEVIAHRGASACAPENTLASFALAARMKADYAELDCHLTRDGAVLVCHDTNVDRTTNGKGNIRDLTLAELKRLDAGSWMDARFAGQRLPTLREMLELARDQGIGVYIHLTSYDDRVSAQRILKIAGGRVLARDPAFAREAMQAIEDSNSPSLELARKAIAAVRETGMQKRVVMQSFSSIVCAVIRIEAPDLPLGLLVGEADPVKWESLMHWNRLIGVDACNVMDKALTAERLQAIHAAGHTVAVWTVDDPAEMKRFARMGVDQIITNKPDVCLKALQEVGRR